MKDQRFHFFPARIHVATTRYAQFEGGPWPEDAGLRLIVIVTTSEVYVTGIWSDSGQSELYSFKDDTGLDLLKGGGGVTALGISRDCKAAMFEISGQAPPAAAAARVLSSGRILVSTACAKRSFKSGNVAAKKDMKGSVGGFEFHVSLVVPPEDDESGLEIELRRNAQGQQLRDVAQIWFEDSAGRRLEVEQLSSYARGTDDESRIKDRFLFRESVKSFVIVVELWRDRVEHSVEYSISSTIGCGM